jgi:hypothetical protein
VAEECPLDRPITNPFRFHGRHPATFESRNRQMAPPRRAHGVFAG